MLSSQSDDYQETKYECIVQYKLPTLQEKGSILIFTALHRRDIPSFATSPDQKTQQLSEQ